MVLCCSWRIAPLDYQPKSVLADYPEGGAIHYPSETVSLADYFFLFFITSPTRPEPKRNRVAGSGTGAVLTLSM